MHWLFFCILLFVCKSVKKTIIRVSYVWYIRSINTTYDVFLRTYVVLLCNYVRIKIMSSKIGSKTSVFHDYFLSRKTVIKVPARKNRFDLGLGTLYVQGIGVHIPNKTSFGNRVFLWHCKSKCNIFWNLLFCYFSGCNKFRTSFGKTFHYLLDKMSLP